MDFLLTAIRAGVVVYGPTPAEPAQITLAQFAHTIYTAIRPRT